MNSQRNTFLCHWFDSTRVRTHGSKSADLSKRDMDTHLFQPSRLVLYIVQRAFPVLGDQGFEPVGSNHGLVKPMT